MRTVRSRALLFAALVPLLAGCTIKAEADAKANAGNPLAPTPSGVTAIKPYTTNKKVVADCRLEVTFGIVVIPESASQTVDDWKANGDGEIISKSSTAATLLMTRTGVAWVTAIKGNVSGNSEKIEYTLPAHCSPPPSTPEPSVDLKVNGSDGPVTVAPNTTVDVLWAFTNCSTGIWIDGPFRGQIVGGNGSVRTNISSNTRFGMECTGPGGKDVDYVDVNVTSTPPPPPPAPTQLVITPTHLTLVPTTCPQAGPTTGQITANMAVTWASSNQHVASVNANGVVTGLNSGQAAITATAADGQQRQATVVVGNCPSPTPTPANLNVTPRTLTFQLPGSGCTATGPLTITATSNQTITLSGWNSSIISVSTSTPQSGSPVTVTALAAGVTTIVATSGGETISVSVTVNSCAPANVCAGANASLPDLDTKGQIRGFVINAPSGCKWALRSNNHHVVSVNPAEGTGPSSGSLTALNSGGPVTITFVVNPGPSETLVSTRTYTIR